MNQIQLNIHSEINLISKIYLTVNVQKYLRKFKRLNRSSLEKLQNRNDSPNFRKWCLLPYSKPLKNFRKFRKFLLKKKSQILITGFCGACTVRIWKPVEFWSLFWKLLLISILPVMGKKISFNLITSFFFSKNFGYVLFSIWSSEFQLTIYLSALSPFFIFIKK